MTGTGVAIETLLVKVNASLGYWLSRGHHLRLVDTTFITPVQPDYEGQLP